MNVKAIIGLLAVGAAALTLSSGRGKGRRRRATFGSTPEQHRARREQLLPSLARSARAVTTALDADDCHKALIELEDYTDVLARVDSENAARRADDGWTPPRYGHLLRRFQRMCVTKAPHTRVSQAEVEEEAERRTQTFLMLIGKGFKTKKKLDGLGLDPAQHGINRSTHSVQAGFKLKDAVKAARNGWCSSAIRALREAEYEAGQTTAHSKSIPGEAGVMPRRKAQATRVAVNRAAKQVMQACTVHRAKGLKVSGRQGKLPF